MKGTSFQKPLEIQLVVDGEAWHQGDLLKGTLRVRNRGNEPVDLPNLRIVIAHGTDKKVKAKADDAFAPVAAIQPGEGKGTVAPGAESTPLEWEYRLEDNASVTDKSGSLYLLYGRGEDLSQLGQLQLIVYPRKHVLEFIEVLEDRFQYVTKQKKAAKGGAVEAKLVPPSGRSHTSIEHVILGFRTEDKDIAVTFTFHVKEVDPKSPTLAFRKARKTFERVYSPDQYLLTYSQRLNKDVVEKSLDEIFTELKSGSLL